MRDWAGGGFFSACVTMSFFFHALLLFLFFMVPPSPRSISLDVLAESNRFIRYAVLEPPSTIRGGFGLPTEPAGPPSQGAEAHREEPSRTAGEIDDERSAPPRPPRSGGGSGVEGPSSDGGSPFDREEAQAFAASSGILSALGGVEQGLPFGSGLGAGGDPEASLGALIGVNSRASFGYGGLGIRGAGRCGAIPSRGSFRAGAIGRSDSECVVEGAIAFGQLNTIGRGGGGGGGDEYGYGVGGLSGRRSAIPCDESGVGGCVRFCTGNRPCVAVTGSLSREVVRRYVRRHRREVEFCYDQALIGRPDLAGRVEIQFVISGAGQVVTSRAVDSTVENDELESCVARAIERISFPIGDGSLTATVVTYPFVFMSAEGV